MEDSIREASHTPKLYGHTGAIKKKNVWKYFRFIEAKDGSATTTNLDMIKAIYINYVGIHKLTKKSTPLT